MNSQDKVYEVTKIKVATCNICSKSFSRKAKFCMFCGIQLQEGEEKASKMKMEAVNFYQSWKEEIAGEVAKGRRVRKVEKKEFIRREPLKEAVREIKEVKKKDLSMEEVLALYNKGCGLCDMGRYDDGLRYFDEILESYPGHSKILVRKGCVLHSMGRYEKALECYDEALKAEPENSEAYENKGAALNKLGKYKEAIECFNKARDL